MRKIFAISLLYLISCVSLLFGDVIYQQVRVYYSDPIELRQLHKIGIPLDHVRVKKGVFIDVTATKMQVEKVREAGFTVEILQEDLTQFFKARFRPELKRHKGFKLGSMGGNYTFDEMVAVLDSLHNEYPTLVSEKMNIGSSYEGRPIWAVKISDNVDEDENVGGEYEPLVLYTGVTHAREPVGMMNLIYFMYYLCENYGTNPNITHIVDNRELWFVPIINPDGYVYNETIEPNGGGMHRKNRRPGCPDNQGVDLNRNYSYYWGLNNAGSSPDSCSQVYRGKGPFSEPETAVIRDFMLSKSKGSFGNLKNVLHYHTYSNLLIHSFGTGEYPPEPDLSMLREFGAEMTKYNHYQVGTGIETVGYEVNGDAVDYSYGELGLVAYTPEVGSYSDSFWPPTDRIVPLCEENIYPNLYFAKIAGTFLKITNVETNVDYLTPSESFVFNFDVKNVGLRNSLNSVIATVVPLNSNLLFQPVSENLGIIDARETIEFPIAINATVRDSTTIGCTAGLVVHLSVSNQETFVDTVSYIIGTPTVFMEDDAESGMDNWNTSRWGQSNTSYEGSYSFTDSPGGNYKASAFNVFELIEPVDLSETSQAVMTFWAKWEIEAEWDFVQVQASTDGNEWIPLAGKYTSGGSGYGVQTYGEPGYEGNQWDWVEETIDLSQFAGSSSFYFRFVLRSDEYVQRDGFYVDDIKIFAYPEIDVSPGDVNRDCTVDVTDILRVVNIILNPKIATESEMKLADMNNDGNVDVFDIVLLVEVITGK